MSRRKAIWLLIAVLVLCMALFAGLLAWLAAGPVSDWASKDKPSAETPSAQPTPIATEDRWPAASESPAAPAAWDAQITDEDPIRRAALRGALSMVTWSPASMRGEGDGGLAHPELFSAEARKQLDSDAADGPLEGGDWMSRADDDQSSVGSVKIIDDEGTPEYADKPKPATEVTVYSTWKWVPTGDPDGEGEWSPWARIFYLTMVQKEGQWVVDSYEMELVARSDVELAHP